MKALGITRKKRPFFMKEETRKKEVLKYKKEYDIVYTDESGVKNTLINEYDWSLSQRIRS